MLINVPFCFGNLRNNLIRSWMILVEFWSIATEHCGLEVSDLRQFSDNLIGIFFLFYDINIYEGVFLYKKWIIFGSFAQELLEIYAWQSLKLTPRDIFLPVTPSGTPSALIIQAMSVWDYGGVGVSDMGQHDVIKWKHFPRYWPFVWGIHRWIPRTKASDAELWCFLWSAPE